MKHASGLAPVDFLIVGTGRTGTTTLFELLRRHPDIFIPPGKECKYFSCTLDEYAGPGHPYARTVTRTLEDYQALFRKAKPGQLCGDISPDYLYFHQAAVPKIIRETSTHIPIIIILRNPIDRAHSSYLYHVRDGRETLNFEDALNAEEERRAASWPWGWRYVDASLYAEQVKAYTDNFERVLLMLFERDIVTGRAANMILDFLNLSRLPEKLTSIHVNASGYPKSRMMHRLKTRIFADELIGRKIKNLIKKTPFHANSKRLYRRILQTNLEKTDMKPETRAMLTDRFRDNVNLLADQTGLPVHQYWADFTPCA